MAPTPMVLDVDTGIDDALALLYAVASPEMDLHAATCVMGNVTVDQAVENTLAVLDAAGRSDVAVARGAERPLVRDHTPFPIVHGEHGLGRVRPRPVDRRPIDTPAASFIAAAARERPGDLVLVATGPLTNVAVALAEEPRLPELLGGFALMGGAFDQAGNVTPAAEANVWVDPEAASAVFRGFSGAPASRLPICVGLDVTERVRMTHGDVDFVCEPAPDSALGRFLRDLVPFYIDFYAAHGETQGAAMHDPLALAIAIDPSLAKLVTTRVEVETDGLWTRGETVADLRGIRRTSWSMGWQDDDNARVAIDVDAPAFTARFLERLRGLVEARA